MRKQMKKNKVVIKLIMLAKIDINKAGNIDLKDS